LDFLALNAIMFCPFNYRYLSYRESRRCLYSPLRKG